MDGREKANDQTKISPKPKDTTVGNADPTAEDDETAPPARRKDNESDASRSNDGQADRAEEEL